MATFSPDQQDQLKAILGYASIPHLLTNELSEQRSQYVIDQAANLLDEMTEIDRQLKAARADSMAKGVGRMRLSYSQHVAHLKSEGSRLLQELGQMLGIEILYNKYSKGQSSYTKSYW